MHDVADSEEKETARERPGGVELEGKPRREAGIESQNLMVDNDNDNVTVRNGKRSTSQMKVQQKT